MSFKDLNLKREYNSDVDNLVYDFYVPVLKTAVDYWRLAGYFSSNSLAVAACGITGLLENNGTIKIIASPQLAKRDIELIKKSNGNYLSVIENNILEDLNLIEDAFVKDHIYALAWMLANRKLEIKIAIVFSKDNIPLSDNEIYNQGIFHQKVGILRDQEGNIISFSGSINETARGWIGNNEEFKVFKNWNEEQKHYVTSDIQKFNKYWNDTAVSTKVIDLPLAVQKKLVSCAPKTYYSINIKKWYSDQRRPELFAHQKDAITKWIANDKIGLFEMATGSGKTFAAFGCLDKIYKDYTNLVVVISCPYGHLVQQWKRELLRYNIIFDKVIIADSSNSKWNKETFNALADLSMYGSNKPVIVITTHSTSSLPKFLNLIKKIPGNTYFLIADEVHGVGAEMNQRAMLDVYRLRLGLSATPNRWLDDAGSQAIYNYFGGNPIYCFGLKEALVTINPITGQSYLCPYYYSVHFVSLVEEELENYINLTIRIIRLSNSKKHQNSQQLNSLLFQRANIIKNATAKYEKLKEILEELKYKDEGYFGTIIYCSPKQINEVMNIMNQKDIIAHKFTMEEGTVAQKEYQNKSERDYILEKFGEGLYQVLVAMKCLDEGVDVPQARNAILISSSGNPREYVQRIGRVIRRYPKKQLAYIYDIMVVPSLDKLPHNMRNYEKIIFKKELRRCEEIAKIAKNNTEALKKIYDYMEGI